MYPVQTVSAPLITLNMSENLTPSKQTKKTLFNVPCMTIVEKNFRRKCDF